ncbi:MAG: hypothetical protein ISS23_03570 [Nanoarchaeota archaeon]|nr:hypothetical protein [Nanoarchaeota archaeon]
MPNLIVSMENKMKERLDRIPWVNWSEIAREEIFKREIFETFIRTGKLSKEEQEFCNKRDWHPVDELPIKEEYLKKLRKIEKGLHSKPMSPAELDKWFDEL